MGRASFKGRNIPLEVSAVSGWLRFDHATITGSGYSSVPDMLNVNPAIQTTDARRPVQAFSNNGFPIATFTDDVLQWPLQTYNNGDVKWGIGCWIKLANTAGIKVLATITNTAGGASANKNNPLITGSAMRIDDQPVDRHAQGGTLNTSWHFVTYEVDCSQSTEATQVLLSIDTVLQSVSFNSGTPWSSNWGSPTGNMLIGASTLVPNSPFVGSIGPNIYTFSRQLTAAERTALMNFEQPT